MNLFINKDKQIVARGGEFSERRVEALGFKLPSNCDRKVDLSIFRSIEMYVPRYSFLLPKEFTD